MGSAPVHACHGNWGCRLLTVELGQATESSLVFSNEGEKKIGRKYDLICVFLVCCVGRWEKKER